MTHPDDLTEDEWRARRIVRACATITREWDALTPRCVPAKRPGRGGGVLAADHDDTDADMRDIDRRASVQRNALDVLHPWCRVIIGEHLTKDDGTLKIGEDKLPGGLDAKAMARFVARNAEWLSSFEAGEDAAEELTAIARRIASITSPRVREWITLGACPMIVPSSDDAPADHACRGRVGVRIGGDDPTEATCSHCHQVGPVEWWEQVLGVMILPSAVRATEMARILSARLGIAVTRQHLHRLALAGQCPEVAIFGPQPQPPRRWFDPRAVLATFALRDRPCPMCGRIWSGHGGVCGRCVVVAKWARPRRAARRPKPTPTARAAPPVVWPRPLDDPRCDDTGMSARWCACPAHSRPDLGDPA